MWARDCQGDHSLTPHNYTKNRPTICIFILPCFVFDGLFISLILLLLLLSCFLVSYVIWKKCTWKLLGYNFVIVQALICWVTICFTWITIKIINWIILSNPKNTFNKFTKPRYQIIQTYFSISVSSIRHLAHSDGPWF